MLDEYQCPTGKMFYLINDFHQWEAWSPWEKMVGEKYEEGLASLKAIAEN